MGSQSQGVGFKPKAPTTYVVLSPLSRSSDTTSSKKRSQIAQGPVRALSAWVPNSFAVRVPVPVAWLLL